MELVGLSNTRKRRRCKMIRSASQAVRYLRQRIAVTAAGSNGAISVWDDREGNYRAEAMAYRITIEAKVFTNLKATAIWITAWLRKIA